MFTTVWQWEDLLRFCTAFQIKSLHIKIETDVQCVRSNIFRSHFQMKTTCWSYIKKRKDETCWFHLQSNRNFFWWKLCKLLLQHWDLDWQFERSKLQHVWASFKFYLLCNSQLCVFHGVHRNGTSSLEKRKWIITMWPSGVIQTQVAAVVGFSQQRYPILGANEWSATCSCSNR